MKLTTILACTLLLSLPLAAAESGVFTENFAEAQRTARETNRPLLLEFTGSDWCPPCRAMASEVLGTEEFATFARENIVAVKLDFPRSRQIPENTRQQNRKLQERYDVRGYPTFILVGADGTELARHVGYMRGGVAAFTTWVRNATPAPQAAN